MSRFCEACGKPLPIGARSDCRYCPGISTCRSRGARTRKQAKIWGALDDGTEDKIFVQR